MHIYKVSATRFVNVTSHAMLARLHISINLLLSNCEFPDFNIRIEEKIEKEKAKVLISEVSCPKEKRVIPLSKGS